MTSGRVWLCPTNAHHRAGLNLPPFHVQRQSSSCVGTVRKCLPAAPRAVCKDWQPGTGPGAMQGDSQLSQMHVFAVGHQGFGNSMSSARGLGFGMRVWLAAKDPAGRTSYVLRDVYYCHCFLLSKQANVTQFNQHPSSFQSWLPGKDNFPEVL